MLLRNGYDYVPYCSLESIVEKNKDQYYLALRKAQKSFEATHAEMKDWLRTLIKQKTILHRRIDQEANLTLGKLSPVSTQILQLVNRQQRVTI